jgi:circadian clock protein KaiC
MTDKLLPRAGTGIAGLDDVLEGGVARNRLHLLEGSPGTGKTTIALMAGAAIGDRGIYVSLAETEEELRQGARSHGWQLADEIAVFELVPPESVLDPERHQSLLYSSDLELGETITRILETIERIKPTRVVIDSLSEIRLLAQSSLRYRRQILALKHYFARHSSTVLMLDDLTSEVTDMAVHSIAHSVIHLEQLAPMAASAGDCGFSNAARNHFAAATTTLSLPGEALRCFQGLSPPSTVNRSAKSPCQAGSPSST